MNERTEALMRIVVGIISGIILGIWKSLVQIISVVHFFMILITGKRNKGIAEFCNMWSTQIYKFVRYMTFATNERVFPFEPLGKDILKYEK